jgi:hypothetical protein
MPDDICKIGEGMAGRPGRPRKWISNAERMRAYRAVERARREALRGHHDVGEMAERVVDLTAERDRLWQQVVRLQQRIAQLENALAGRAPEPTATTPAPAAHVGPSRAERRRLEREQQRRRAR